MGLAERIRDRELAETPPSLSLIQHSLQLCVGDPRILQRVGDIGMPQLPLDGSGIAGLSS
jgi:hypothetical protein